MKNIRYRTLGETWVGVLREVCHSSDVVGDAREAMHVCA